jgi:hypothetical protein
MKVNLINATHIAQKYEVWRYVFIAFHRTVKKNQVNGNEACNIVLIGILK